MRRTEARTAVVERKEAGCRHHWVLEAPAGPVSRGVCKRCGEVREFRNYLDTPYWDRDVSPEPVPLKGLAAPDDLLEE